MTNNQPVDGHGDVPRLVDIKALADLLGTSIRHIRRLVADARMPYIKVGHFIRFDLHDISHWLDVNRHDVPI